MDGSGLPISDEQLPFEFDPDAVEDWDVFELLEPAVQEWWLREFGEFVPENGGFFTPPQRGAIPKIHEGTNTLIAAPTGSGKCVKPDTPMIVQDDGEATVLRANDLLERRQRKVADVDEDGELHTSSVEAYSLDEDELTLRQSMVYSERYDGPLHRIRTSYGREVEVTPDHPLLVETSSGPEWRSASTIEAGDRIGIPTRIELPERAIDLDVCAALDRLRSEFPLVATEAESDRVVARLEDEAPISVFDESERWLAMALAGLSLPDVADRLSISVSSVWKLVTGETEYRAGEFLALLRTECTPLEPGDVLVKTDNGRVSRFRYPTTLDSDLADLAAFVLAEGLIGEYDRGTFVTISQKNRTGLLEQAMETMRDQFGVEFERKTEIDYIIPNTAFSVFFSELLDIESGPGRDVPLPNWVLNASKPIKRSFLSTFLSLEAEIRSDEVRLVQANELKIEQVTYLLLSFGILPARGRREKYATNTDEQTRREYHSLTVRGVENLSTLLSECSLVHPTVDELRAHASRQGNGNHIGRHAFDYRDIRALSKYFENDRAFNAELGTIYEVARRSGHLTERALETLSTKLKSLPSDETTRELAAMIDDRLNRNVAWVTVESNETAHYSGRIIDLSVPDTHNFVGGRGGVYLHNTLASFTSIIDELYRRDRNDDGLENSVYCLYISPLKSLANDIHRNLEVPLEGITSILEERGEDVGEIRHAIRHGDTSSSDRQKMLAETPHILNTTPETLAILLNSPKFREKLRTVEYVIVDEIHALAGGKRGTHMAVSLERLAALTHEEFTRIGCSATIEPLSRVAEFLVGQCEAPRASDGRVARDENRPSNHASELEAREQTENSVSREPGAVPRTADERTGSEATREPREAPRASERGAGSEATRESSDPGDQTRDYELVDARFAREFDLELECPTDDLINTSRDIVQDRFYHMLHEHIQDHTNTLVFTNTRSGAERVLHNLRERFDEYDEDNSGCHHGSLSKEVRQGIESRLKDGDLEVVTSSTSLELGIDMPHVDLVVQVGSPKSVAALLQRVGRAGHRVGQTVTGRVIALDRDELVECAVMLKKAEEGFVDSVSIPENAQDVAAQHVYGMAIAEIRPESEVKAILRRAYPYRNYGEDDFEQLMRYLTADYAGLEDRNVYAKVWRDENDPPDGEHHHESFPVGEPLIGKRGRLARVIYMTNIGTIPDSFTCDVSTRGSNEWVGQLDESYLDTLEKGDVFVLGGDHFEYRYRRGSKVYVDRTSARPTVPSWYSERLPLSYDLGCEILAFQRELLERYESGGPPAVRAWLRELPLDDDSVRALARLFDYQLRYAGPESVSTDSRLVVEVERDRQEYERHYYVHSAYGRKVNDGLSRLLAYECAQEATANVQVAVADNGFVLSMPLNRKVDLEGILEDLRPEDVRGKLRNALSGTDLLQRYFRINATRSLMILKRYKGYEKSASEQQVSSEMLLGFAEDLEEFAVIEETYREILEDKLNVAEIEGIVGAMAAGDLEVSRHLLDSPTPRAFGLATLSASDVVLAEDESAALQAFHEHVLEEIGEESLAGLSGAVSNE
ncbi:ATP-dependent helicase [Halobacteria archaeon AArc-xg1-1]|uniref:ATP-dependent helicase n=1 Tax=Natronoglomus mannanivorans TaxID=2979990 RepID=A0AAP2YVN7_9EURY|nr:ATP-dependent helicase [Halobacteria archaeon AArc-xg1-1]